ncbi:MAG: hypothetical protein DMC57_09945 [Verrucomicrobia bacterium]|nr:MAG: hypothetical protein DMC57_09945 [Verrucomicrobiota bacterium]
MERRTRGAGQCAGIARLHLFGGRLCGRILDACLFSQSAEFHRTARSGHARAGNELWPGVAVGEYFARRGERFVPEDELHAVNLSASDLVDAPAAFLPIYSRWIAEARAGLDAGLEYAIAINPARVRVATVLPAMIGVRTLSLLEESGLDALRTRVKVPRSEVRGMIASTTITLASQSRLRRARAQLSGSG